MKVPEAANRRFICSEGLHWIKDVVAFVAERYGPEGWPVPTEHERPDNFEEDFWTLDNTASKEVLQVHYRPISETIVDMATMMIERGIVTKPASS